MESPGRKRKAFTLKEKLDAIARVKSGISQMQVARELGIGNFSFLVKNAHFYSSLIKLTGPI